MAKKCKYKKWLEPDNLLRLSAWARDGLSNEDIAKNMGIAAGTLYDWVKKYSEIDEALKTTREVADIVIENALYKRAEGYTYTEEVAFKCKTVSWKDGKRVEEDEIKTATIHKHMPPDTTAQIFWLSNRKRDTWRRNPDNEDNNREPVKIELVGDTIDYAK